MTLGSSREPELPVSPGSPGEILETLQCTIYWQCVEDTMFCTFASRPIYKTPIWVSCFW